MTYKLHAYKLYYCLTAYAFQTKHDFILKAMAMFRTINNTVQEPTYHTTLLHLVKTAIPHSSQHRVISQIFYEETVDAECYHSILTQQVTLLEVKGICIIASGHFLPASTNKHGTAGMIVHFRVMTVPLFVRFLFTGQSQQMCNEHDPLCSVASNKVKWMGDYIQETGSQFWNLLYTNTLHTVLYFIH